MKGTDLNLLRVFDALMRERQVARAATLLGLSAPAMSNALARLRRATGDELFTRTPTGMLPTAHAQAMAAGVAQALAALETSLQRPEAFAPEHPERGRRAFRLAMTDIGEVYFLPTLVAALAEAAPGVTLSTVRLNTPALAEAMASGTVDLALGWLPALGAGFHQRRLFTQRYVALMAAGHPLAKGRLTLPRFLAARQAVVVSEGTGHERVRQLLRRQGLPEPLALQLPHFVALPYILADSDLVATVPEKLAEKTLAPFGLVQRALPFELPPFEVNVFWHRRAHQEPGNRWLREQLVQRFAAAA